MRQFSDDEEGFIPAEIEVKHKQATRNAHRKQASQRNNNFPQIQYRFADGFVKKEPQLAYSTPLTLYTQPLTTNAHLDRKQKSKNTFETPYREYCADETYTLCYCRQSGEPLLQERVYMKNEVSLMNIEDKNSPSLKELKPFEMEECSSIDDSLVFDSRFQCGNLHCAFRRRGTNQYHLFMSNDTNTLGYNQWFYFSIQNAKKGVKYSFRIVNYKKLLDFFRNGQRIALFSLKQAHKASTGWSWNGNNINFQQSSIRAYSEIKMYTLRFQIQPKHNNDYIMLASTIPYSYSRLRQDIQRLEKETKALDHINFSVKSICNTVCNNEVPEITITGNGGQRKQKDKKIIIFMGRQHPGEVWSSYMILGVLNGLLKQTPQIKYILDNCIIKIYPMVNVDGVIYGNFRCDITGVDLNRRWKEPSKIFHPQIYEIKRKIQNCSKRSKIQACFDFHGHSKKYNIFCYSCKHNSYTCRILPYLISAHNNVFNIPSCTFGITRDKESTARASISKILRSENVLTIQTSCFGERMNLEGKQFHPLDIFRMSDSILVALRYFVDKKSPKFQQSEKAIKQNYQKFLNYDKENEQQSGSDSQPQLDEIDFKTKISTIIDKKFTHQYKSFARDCFNNAQLHCSEIIFENERGESARDCLERSEINLEYIQEQVKKIEVNTNEKFKESRFISDHKKNVSNLRTTKQLSLQNTQKHSTTINRSQLDNLSGNSKKISVPKITLKNILIRDKKRLSYVHDFASSDKREIATINVAQQEINRSKDFRDIRKEEQDRKAIEQFVNKYEKFIPNSIAYKGKARLDVLQEGLDHDDGQFQLNVMLQNKRKIQLEKLKQRIEQSTKIAQRQGKIKWNTNRKEPIIDYRKFKYNEKLKHQVRKLGELSERYLEGHH